MPHMIISALLNNKVTSFIFNILVGFYSGALARNVLNIQQIGIWRHIWNQLTSIAKVPLYPMQTDHIH